MTQINIMERGDTVLTVDSHFLAIRKASGEVEIYRVILTGDGRFTVEPKKIAVIGYGDGMIRDQDPDGKATYFSF